jgi:hypothetical protein
MQVLPDGNVFTSWSKNGYQSEFTASGNCVLDASFTSDRFNSYRAFKHNFTGNPVESPIIKAFAYKVHPSTIMTVTYVSWNGATEVRSWNFYNSTTVSSRGALVGNTPKTGFESMFISDGYMESVWVEALDANGRVLRASEKVQTILFTNSMPSFVKKPDTPIEITGLKLIQAPPSMASLSGIFLMLPLGSAALLLILIVHHRDKLLSGFRLLL